MSVGWSVEDVSYCNSKKRPALEAVGVVTDLVVVSESKTKAAYESLFDNGVDVWFKSEDRRCDRIVVFPEPLSPLQ